MAEPCDCPGVRLAPAPASPDSNMVTAWCVRAADGGFVCWQWQSDMPMAAKVYVTAHALSNPRPTTVDPTTVTWPEGAP